MKTIMIIGGGKLQIPLINICKKNGYKVIVTDRDKSAEGFQYADINIIVDGTDKEKILDYAKYYKIDGIVTTAEITLYTVAYVCEKLKLNGFSYKAASTSNNKWTMRECMKKNNMYCPKYWNVNTIEEIDEISQNLVFPLILKPTDSSGSLGVKKIDNIVELKNSINDTLKLSKNGGAILEEYIDGPEFSIETLSKEGKHNIIAITEKKVTGYPFFVEERHKIPADLTFTDRKQIEETVISLLNACEFNNCAAHTELKLSKKGPVIIETGARIGGDFIAAELVPLATGISMHENIAKVALGEEIDIIPKFNHFAAIQYVTPDNYEIIKNKFKNILKDRNLVRYEFDINSKVVKLENSLNRIGYFIFKADEKLDLLNSLNNLEGI